MFSANMKDKKKHFNLTFIYLHFSTIAASKVVERPRSLGLLCLPLPVPVWVGASQQAPGEGPPEVSLHQAGT